MSNGVNTTVPPVNEDAENHVVGACLYHPDVLDTISETVRPHHLYFRRPIYQAILNVHERGDPVEPVIVAEELGQNHQAIQTMRELAALHYTTGNVEHHARIVLDYATRRQLITVGQEIARAGWEPSRPLQDELGHAEQLVYDLTTQQEPGELRAISETLDHTYAQLERPGGEITGTPTGILELDRITAGFQPGNMIVIAARPGMGKSALALEVARHAALDNKQAAAVFSLEMSAEEINQRLLSVQARIPLMWIRTREALTAEARHALHAARPALTNAPLYVDDTVSARITDIRARARRLKARRPDLAVIVVDYLQLMIHDGRAENRNLEVAAISRGLKLLARELDVPILALAQLNRMVEQRADKTPMLADLRDSGAIEQDADVVLFIHRPDEDGTATITVAKHRNGPTGATKVAWLKKRATFGNLA